MNDAVKIIPLGGLGRIGKNMTVIEYQEEIIVIDCGLGFPEEHMYGIDLVIPDVTYLMTNQNKIKGFFFTHGHEDHIGAIPYIVSQVNAPLYGTPLTIGLIKSKLEEHQLIQEATCNTVQPGETVVLDKLAVEFINNTHSIAGACCLGIHTPEGVILHTGDFKIDHTPVAGKGMDLQRIGELGKSGVLLLLSDSTNVERRGHSPSESSIGSTLDRLFAPRKGRIIVATFASNIHRIQQIIDVSIKYGRKVAFSGRSMERITKVACDLGELIIPPLTQISVSEIKAYPNDQITLITTGSQGEEGAGLTRIATSRHRQIQIVPDDLFIISASPIPGNDRIVGKVIDALYRKGAEVVYKQLEEVHVSGHAYQEELKLMYTLTQPHYFMPVHGEYRHLVQHRKLIEKMGMAKENIFLLEEGEVLEVKRKGAHIKGKVASGDILVDGIGIGDVGNIVLKDRRQLAKEGMIVIVAALDFVGYELVSGPELITRGFVYVREAEPLIAEIKAEVTKELEMCLAYQTTEWAVLKNNIRKVVEELVYARTKRKPTVLPLILEV